MRKLVCGIVECSSISEVYLRMPTKSDEFKIKALHKKGHDLSGCLGSLDVTKIHWGQCPAGWKGQFQGKEVYPTIGLQAVSDYNLWIWQSVFGYLGSPNDINIWDWSPLYEPMLDGTHDKIDFSFEINGEHFSQLYCLDDGVYPSLSRYLLTVNDQTTPLDCFFALRQERFMKSITRAFGVFGSASFFLWIKGFTLSL